jgi:hypothetical protein
MTTVLRSSRAEAYLEQVEQQELDPIELVFSFLTAVFLVIVDWLRPQKCAET